MFVTYRNPKSRHDGTIVSILGVDPLWHTNFRVGGFDKYGAWHEWYSDVKYLDGFDGV
jgi:hypothetical protein